MVPTIQATFSAFPQSTVFIVNVEAISDPGGAR